MAKIKIEEIKTKILSLAEFFYQDKKDFVEPLEVKYPNIKRYLIDKAMNELISSGDLEVKVVNYGKRWYRKPAHIHAHSA